MFCNENVLLLVINPIKRTKLVARDDVDVEHRKLSVNESFHLSG